jgi:hypothetical protein
VIVVATFESCSFVDNAVMAITFYQYRPQVLVKACYFEGTDAVRNWDTGSGSGWVTMEACLFAGDVPSMLTRVTLTGVQFAYTSTEIGFNTASMIPTCGGIAGPTHVFEETMLVWGDIVDEIEVISERYTPFGSVIEINVTIFSDIFHDGEGGAIFVDSRSLVSIRSDFSRTARRETPPT